MIEVKFKHNADKLQAQMRVKGHAGFATEGDDIVCSAASILASTLQQEIMIADGRGMLKYPPTLRAGKGDSKIVCRAKTEEDYAEILRIFLTIQTGYQLLCHNYPQYVNCELFS